MDDGATLTVDAGSVGSFTGAYGTLQLTANGNYTYTLNTSGVQHLAQGASITDSFGYQAKDAQGALSNTASVTITINGDNNTTRPNSSPHIMTDDHFTFNENVLTND